MKFLFGSKPPTTKDSSKYARDRFKLTRSSTLVNDPPLLSENWELDLKYISALIDWSNKNPETTLNRVFADVSSAISRGDGFIELIPNSPFPARGLVKSLAVLVQLGESMTNANLKVEKLAWEIVEWVSDIKESLESAGNGNLTKATWKNLARMQWAAERLADKRWALARLNTEDEVAEFRTRIHEARQIFQDQSLIRISGGIDAVLQKFEKHEDKIGAVLDKIVTTQEMQFQRIMEEQARQRYLEQNLNPLTVAKPTYVTQAKAPCHEGTRTKVLDDIRQWINDVSTASQNFLWLTGDPGCGKSAITASIAQEYRKQHVLWAQFFVNRNAIETTNPNTYFPSIARQMSEHSEALEHHVYDTLKRDPTVTDEISALQASELFIGTLQKAASLNPSTPVLVVIDGLDETDKLRLQDTATIFSQLFEGLPQHLNAKILISSRTENEIYRPFTTMMDVKHVKHIHLDTSDSFKDVLLYLETALSSVFMKHGLAPAFWLTSERLQMLADQASGLFVWAVTVVRLVNAHLTKQGREGLHSVFSTLTGSTRMKDINELYGVTLDLVYDDDAELWNLEKFRRIMGAIVVAREPLTLKQLEELLDLRKTPDSDLVDIEHFVRSLRTVLIAGLDDVTMDTIPRLHKSFYEYVTSDNTAERFRVDVDAANAEMAFQCLYHITSAYAIVHSTQFSSTLSDVKHLPYAIRYSLRFCTSHLQKKDDTMHGVMLDNSARDLTEFASLLRRSSTKHGMGPMTISFQQNPLCISTYIDDHRLFWNVGDGHTTTPIVLAEQHSSFIESVVFSPDGYHIVSGSVDNSLFLWNAFSLKHIAVFKGHINLVHSVAFSAQGNRIISGSYDETIRIWDANTGDSIGKPLKGHTKGVTSVVFSPDCAHIVSGSIDGTIKVWDANTGKLVNRTSMSHSQSVWSVAVSSNGAWILSASEDQTICLWDFQTQRMIGEPLVGHTEAVCFAAISSNMEYIVSGSDDRTVRLWDPKTRAQIGEPWEGHTLAVYSVAFSPSGDKVASGSIDGTIRLWDVPSGQALAVIPASDDGPCLVYFSPDGEQIVMGHGTSLAIANTAPYFNNIRPTSADAWTSFSPSGNMIAVAGRHGGLSLIKTNSDRVAKLALDRASKVVFEQIAFSPGDQFIAAASADGAVYLWDTSSCNLVGSSNISIGNISSISFLHDRTPPTLRLAVEGTVFVLKLADDGTLVLENTSLGPTTSDTMHLFFDTSQKPHPGLSGVQNRRLRNVQWFSGKEDTKLVWACVNDHFIRCEPDGQFLIFPVDEMIS
ncbi:hypothetical protein H0H92_008505 [Tricholoma furcatifolium]|nr:hypothetical protein H0H92_008505 [Tricholoma furcatifolium]